MGLTDLELATGEVFTTPNTHLLQMKNKTMIRSNPSATPQQLQPCTELVKVFKLA
jgi:hypothetical protein